MKTNIQLVNGTYAATIGEVAFYAGRDEEGETVIGYCDLYRAIDGTVFAYSKVTNEVVTDYDVIVRYNSQWAHWCGNKRGRHSRSNNKNEWRKARNKKILEGLDDLPF